MKTLLKCCVGITKSKRNCILEVAKSGKIVAPIGLTKESFELNTLLRELSFSLKGLTAKILKEINEFDNMLPTITVLCSNEIHPKTNVLLN